MVRLQFGYSSVTVQLQFSYSSITVQLQFRYSSVTVLLQISQTSITVWLWFGLFETFLIDFVSTVISFFSIMIEQPEAGMSRHFWGCLSFFILNTKFLDCI